MRSIPGWVAGALGVSAIVGAFYLGGRVDAGSVANVSLPAIDVATTAPAATTLASPELAVECEPGQRAVVRDRLGRVVEDIGEPDEPQPGRDVVLSIDARLQALAYQRLRDAVQAHGAKSGSL